MSSTGSGRWLRRGTAAALCALLALATAGCSSGSDDRAERMQRASSKYERLTFQTEHAVYTVFIDARHHRAAGIALEPKGAFDTRWLTGNISLPGKTHVFDQAYACQYKASPCMFKKPIGWAAFYGAYDADGIEGSWQNPFRVSATLGLLCDGGACRLLVEQESHVSWVYFTRGGALTGLRMLDLAKGAHVSIILTDGRTLICTAMVCGFQPKNGAGKLDVVAKATNAGFRFAKPLAWANIHGQSAPGRLDQAQLTTSMLDFEPA